MCIVKLIHAHWEDNHEDGPFNHVVLHPGSPEEVWLWWGADDFFVWVQTAEDVVIDLENDATTDLALMDDGEDDELNLM